MEAELRALLVNHPPLAALVGGTGVYWNHLPQASTVPCVVLWKIGGAPDYTMAGPNGLTSSVVQADAWATTVEGLWAIRDAVVARLSGYRDLTFRGIFLTAERQSSEKPNDLLLHRSSMDFDVWARVAA